MQSQILGEAMRQIWCLRQKMLRPDEGRISRAQNALEQPYQNFCAKTREADGLLTQLAELRCLVSLFKSLSTGCARACRSAPDLDRRPTPNGSGQSDFYLLSRIRLVKGMDKTSEVVG